MITGLVKLEQENEKQVEVSQLIQADKPSKSNLLGD